MSGTASKTITRSAFGKSQFLPTKDIKVDRAKYQRQCTAIVGQIVRDFNPLLFEPLTVSDRVWLHGKGNHFYAVDGGNRHEAAMRLGIAEVPVRIVPTHSVQEEALLFNSLNKQRVNVTLANRHRALVAGGDARAVIVEQTMNKAGFTLIRENKTATLPFINITAAAYEIFDLGNKSHWSKPGYVGTPAHLDGPLLLTATVNLIKATWGAKKKDLAWNNNSVKAVALVLSQFWDKDSIVANLKKVMTGYTPAEMKVEADRHAKSPNNYRARAYALGQEYNSALNKHLMVSALKG